MTTMSESEPTTEAVWKRRRRLLLVGAGLVVLFALGRAFGRRLPEFAAWVEGLGWWGPIGYLAVFTVATVALVPSVALTLVAGPIFGLGRGLLWSVLGSTLGALAAFFVARYVARGAVEERLATRPRFAAVDRAVGKEGLKIVFLMRLSPVMPFILLNYMLGLTRVSFRDYLLSSTGMIPRTALYLYYGKVLGDAVAIAGGAPVEKGTAYYVILVLGLIATIAVTAVIARVTRKAVTEAGLAE